jgi:hypothetical protein
MVDASFALTKTMIHLYIYCYSDVDDLSQQQRHLDHGPWILDGRYNGTGI